MPVTAIVGANWGDEGKGKVTDHFAQEADYVVRYQGGNNAGHTIVNHYGKFALHLLPSGVFYPHVMNILGPGVAVNVRALLEEIDNVRSKGVPEPKVKVSDRAQILLPYHILFDELEEQRLAAHKFGSTKSGIAPFYSDKYLKIGIQINEIFDTDRVVSRLNRFLPVKNALLEHLYGHAAVSVDEVIAYIAEYRNSLRGYVADTTYMLHEAISTGKTILLEGQLGALRDPDVGIYPYPTSSSPLAGFASVGAAIPPHKIDRVVAVVKAYSTCVGAGPFVTELSGDTEHTLREKGGSAGEYGATTGRPRRVGWFDCVATTYGCMVQGATEVALTNLDVLGHFDTIKASRAYSVEGKQTSQFPCTKELEKAQPVYDELAGWKTDISDVTSYDRLPSETRGYVDYVEQKIGVPIRFLSVGPKREQMIERT